MEKVFLGHFLQERDPGESVNCPLSHCRHSPSMSSSGSLLRRKLRIVRKNWSFAQNEPAGQGLHPPNPSSTVPGLQTHPLRSRIDAPPIGCFPAGQALHSVSTPPNDISLSPHRMHFFNFLSRRSPAWHILHTPFKSSKVFGGHFPAFLHPADPGFSATVPDGHVRHLEVSSLFENVPTAQGVQEVAPLGDTEPNGQSLQNLVPAASENVPLWQGLHLLLLDKFLGLKSDGALALNCPGRHFKQRFAPAPSDIEPSGHIWHGDNPAFGLKKPARQLKHPPYMNCLPGGHVDKHDDAPCSERVPGGHGLQDVEPSSSWNVLGGQGIHWSLSEAPGVARKFPSEHGSHSPKLLR